MALPLCEEKSGKNNFSTSRSKNTGVVIKLAFISRVYFRLESHLALTGSSQQKIIQKCLHAAQRKIEQHKKTNIKTVHQRLEYAQCFVFSSST